MFFGKGVINADHGYFTTWFWKSLMSVVAIAIK
jgi:hypothetical protein